MPHFRRSPACAHRVFCLPARAVVCCLAVTLAILASACTNWDEQGGTRGAYLQQTGGGGSAIGASDAGADGGLQWVETWQPPAPDAEDASDGGGLPDDATAVDALADVDLGADATPLADAGSDAEADVQVYSFDGKGDFVGWPDAPEPAADALAGDATAADAAGADASGADAGAVDDAGDAGTEDVGAVDAGNEDAGTEDAGTEDAGAVDAAVTDDVAVNDGQIADAQDDVVPPEDAADAIADVADMTGDSLMDALEDALSDVAPDADAASDDVLLLPDGAPAPDWQGYGELPYGDDADIYGGAINSCLALYLYQNETCTGNNPTASCIDGVAKSGSLYAQFLFEPLQVCEKAACVDLCATATDKTCWDQCIAKYCPQQFFACTSNASQGSANCADTMACSNQNPGKLLTISSQCYANATPEAQKQFSTVLSCVSQPQTAACIIPLATCYGATAASSENCNATATCMNACGGDQQCTWSCLGKASPQAVSLLDAVWSCSLTQCKPKCNGDAACEDDCLKTTCQAQLVQCMLN